MGSEVKRHIKSPHEYYRMESGSAGIFVCDKDNPFDADTVGQHGGIILFGASLAGSEINATTATFNKVLGAGFGTTFFDNQLIVAELQYLSLTNDGDKAIIYLKPEK